MAAWKFLVVKTRVVFQNHRTFLPWPEQLGSVIASHRVRGII